MTAVVCPCVSQATIVVVGGGGLGGLGRLYVYQQLCLCVLSPAYALSIGGGDNFPLKCVDSGFENADLKYHMSTCQAGS